MNIGHQDVYQQAYYQALHGFSRRMETELTILLYHGVYDGSVSGIINYNGKHVPVARFRSDMRYINQHCTVLSMDEVVEIGISGEPWPKKSVAVTFDDGFANNHSLAAYVLADVGVPATFYVCPGMMDTTHMFWVDQLEDCLNRSARESINITLDGVARTYNLKDLTHRIAALENIKTVCKRVPVAEKTRILKQVEEATEIEPSPDSWPHYRPASWQQIRDLADNPLFIVGGHSLYHDILALQGRERACLDICTSLRLLEYQLDRPIRHYSYPEGQTHHYNDEVIAALRAEGVICSPSAIVGMNQANLDLFHLRRVMVGFYGLPLPHLDPMLK